MSQSLCLTTGRQPPQKPQKPQKPQPPQKTENRKDRRSPLTTNLPSLVRSNFRHWSLATERKRKQWGGFRCSDTARPSQNQLSKLNREYETGRAEIITNKEHRQTCCENTALSSFCNSPIPMFHPMLASSGRHLIVILMPFRGLTEGSHLSGVPNARTRRSRAGSVHHSASAPCRDGSYRQHCGHS